MSVQVRTPGVFFILMSESRRLRNSLGRRGITCIEIPGATVTDAASFFHTIKDRLPLDPPLSGRVNMDALEDSLWEGISCLGTKEVAILWTDADGMVTAAPDEFFGIIDCLKSVAVSLGAGGKGLDRPVSMKLYLLGDGRGFHSLDEYGLS